jgi:hypothetical protein
MVRVLAAMTAMVPAAGQLFALQWVQGAVDPEPPEGRQFSIDHGDLQMFEATLNSSSLVLQYAEVGPKLSDYVVKSTSTCVDSPSGVYYFVGGKTSQVDCSWRDVNGTYHAEGCVEYNLYGISTATGEKVSEFELPTPNATLMLSFDAMEWQLGCDQAGGVLLLGGWACDEYQGCDLDIYESGRRTIWRYDTKTQAMDGLAQIYTWPEADLNQQRFPAETYGNLAVDAEHGLVSLVYPDYHSGASLTLINTTTGNVSWQLPQVAVCEPGRTDCAPDIFAQVYDPLNKRFFGCGFQMYPNGVVMQYLSFFYWWDETGILQKIFAPSCWRASYATVDLARRAAIFDMDALTYVSLDTGAILYRQGYPSIGGYVYLAGQKGPSPGPPPAALYKCLHDQCQPASSGVSLDTCSTFCGSAVTNSTIVV